MHAVATWYSLPFNHSKDDIEAVADLKLQHRYGVRKVELSAIGCTRRSEANRRGRWALLTNANDRMITFATGLEGAIPSPGHIIAVADSNLAGRDNGGRISSAKGRSITLDREISIKAGDRLIINLPDGKSEGRTVTSVNKKVVTVSVEYSQIPQKETVWVVDSDDLAVQLYRVINISDNGDNTYTISGAIHNPDHYDHIDSGARIDERPVNAGVVRLDKAVTNLDRSFSESQKQVQAKLDNQGALINSKMQAEFKQNVGYAMHNTNITIMVDGKKYSAASMVISAEVKAGKIESFIGFNANNFAFFNPTRGKMEPLMFIKNGQIYMRESFIADASISNAKIGNVIQSNNFVSGKSGWQINKNGNAEFNAVTFRGRIDGADGHFRGTVDAKKVLGDVYFATNKKILGTPLNKTFPKGALETGWVKAIEISSDNFERVFDAGLSCTFETSRASPRVNYSTYAFLVGVDDGKGGIKTLSSSQAKEDINKGLKMTLTVNDIPIPALGRGKSIFVYMHAHTVTVSSNTNRYVKFTFSNTKRAEIYKEGSTLINPISQ